jgi:hypothetical protein
MPVERDIYRVIFPQSVHKLKSFGFVTDVRMEISHSTKYIYQNSESIF